MKIFYELIFLLQMQVDYNREPRDIYSPEFCSDVARLNDEFRAMISSFTSTQLTDIIGFYHTEISPPENFKPYENVKAFEEKNKSTFQSMHAVWGDNAPTVSKLLMHCCRRIAANIQIHPDFGRILIHRAEE